MYVILALIVIAISVYNIVSAIMKKQKLPLILNALFYALVIITLIGSNVNSSIIDNYSKDYDTYHGGILSSVKYERTEGGYYIIVDKGFMCSDEIAIPIESVKIPSVSKIYKPIVLCCSKGTELYEDEITINSKNYYLCETAEKIIPNYFDLFVIIFIIAVIVITIFNLILLIINILPQIKH